MSAWLWQNQPLSAKVKIATGRTPGIPLRIEFASIALLTLACVLEVAGAFVHLDRSSFWIDELYTAYFIDGSLTDVIVKTLRFDTHTPLFSLLMHSWSVLFGRSEIALRAFSATAAVAIIPILYLVSRPLLTRWAALLLATAIPATYYWFDMAQNARPYALALLGASLLLGGLIRAMLAVDRSAMRRAALWIATTSLGFGLLHYYVLLLAGLVMLVAFLRMRDRQAQYILLSSAAALILLLAGYLTLRQTSTTMPPIGEMWFANLWKESHTYLEFLRIGIGSPFNKTLFAVLLIAGCSGFFALKRLDFTSWQELPLVAFSSLVVVASFFMVTLLTSAAGMPTISERNLAIALPFLWFPVCATADWSAGRWPEAWRQALMLVTGILVVAASASIIGYRALPLRENWRDALQATAAMTGCTESEIPLSVGSMYPNVYRSLMAYYAPVIRFRSLVRDRLGNDVTQTFLAERANRIAAGNSTCHALLVMRERNAHRVSALAKRIAARADLVRPIRITGFSHATLNDWHAGHTSAVYLLWIE